MKFTLYKDSSPQFRWRLVASNGKTIADSGEGYRNKQDCLNGIALIQQYAPSAPINDETEQRAWR